MLLTVFNDKAVFHPGFRVPPIIRVTLSCTPGTQLIQLGIFNTNPPQIKVKTESVLCKHRQLLPLCTQTVIRYCVILIGVTARHQSLGYFPMSQWPRWVRYDVKTVFNRYFTLSEYYKGNMAHMKGNMVHMKGNMNMARMKGNMALTKGNMALRHFKKI